MSTLETLLGFGLVTVVGMSAVLLTLLVVARRSLMTDVMKLTDQVESKESELATQTRLTNKVKSELAVCKKNTKRLTSDAEESQTTIRGLRQDLSRYSVIEDAESHAAQVTAAAHDEVSKLRKRAMSYKDQASQLKSQRDSLDRGVRELSAFKDGHDSLEKLMLRIDLEKKAQSQAANEHESALLRLTEQLEQRKAELDFIENEAEMQSFGIYSPRFSFDHSDQYRDAMKKCVAKQKEMVRDKTACTCATTWTVSGSEAKGRTMVNRSIKLMLRAVNGDCDAIIAKVKHNNVESSEKRIRKTFDVINKLGETNEISFSEEYEDLKLQELYLNYEYAAMKQEEKEREREIREAMREEERAQKEIAKARESAEKNEAVKEAALEKARSELADQHGKHNAKLEALVRKLETELSEAIDRKAKAIARAQLTRSGHVYVLSNIGTMGEGVYKIGMTRRLEPLERVKELGDASVPFPFDVHAMIYSEDAPQLESALHKMFDDRRVNLVNLRREYFYVSLDDIRDAVAELHGLVTFKIFADAEQYRESELRRKEATLVSA